MDWPQAFSVFMPALITAVATYAATERKTRVDREVQIAGSKRDALRERIKQLEALYEECLMSLFKYLNEPLSEEKQRTNERNRLGVRLAILSTPAIKDAYLNVMQELKILGRAEPAPPEVKQDPELRDKHIRETLKSAAIAQGRLEDLMRAHLMELQGELEGIGGKKTQPA
jgi:hypothetical protein